jgi:hypothetical protein
MATFIRYSTHVVLFATVFYQGAIKERSSLIMLLVEVFTATGTHETKPSACAHAEQSS